MARARYKPKGKLGSGQRFEAGVQRIMKTRGYSRQRASRIMAYAGRKKYGKVRFQRLATAGRRK